MVMLNVKYNFNNFKQEKVPDQNQLDNNSQGNE